MAKEKKKEAAAEPEINFDKISEDLGNFEQRQHIDQIENALTDVYLQNAKYTDDKGIVRFKKKFNKAEAEKMANGLYDALAYHSHRRVFGMDQKQYEALKQFKDANGNSYVDSVTQYHFKMERRSLVKMLARDDEENRFDHQTLQKILEKPIEQHIGLLQQGLISKHGLDDAKHMDTVKKAIDKIVDTYQLSKKQFNTSKMYDHQDVLQTYVRLASTHYQEGAHEKPKKKAA